MKAQHHQVVSGNKVLQELSVPSFFILIFVFDLDFVVVLNLHIVLLFLNF